MLASREEIKKYAGPATRKRLMLEEELWEEVAQEDCPEHDNGCPINKSGECGPVDCPKNE